MTVFLYYIGLIYCIRSVDLLNSRHAMFASVFTGTVGWRIATMRQ